MPDPNIAAMLPASRGLFRPAKMHPSLRGQPCNLSPSESMIVCQESLFHFWGLQCLTAIGEFLSELKPENEQTSI